MNNPVETTFPPELRGLIRSVLALAADPVTQERLLGDGFIADEMAVNFEFDYLRRRDQLIEEELLGAAQIRALDALQAELDQRDLEEDEAFWIDRRQRHTRAGWRELRKLAQACLVTFDARGLQLVVEQVFRTMNDDSIACPRHHG